VAVEEDQPPLAEVALGEIHPINRRINSDIMISNVLTDPYLKTSIDLTRYVIEEVLYIYFIFVRNSV
jgi:hypothetical protein